MNEGKYFDLLITILSVVLSNAQITIDKDSWFALFLQLFLTHDISYVSIIEHLLYSLYLWVQMNFILFLHLFFLTLNLLIFDILLHVYPTIVIFH